MDLRRILAATDESDAGREAVRVASYLGARASARVTVLRVMAAEATRQLVGTAHGVEPDDDAPDEPALGHLRRWLQADVLSPSAIQQVELATAA
ncbi:MAG TPA: universal stress protein, partial [Gemmatimonadales bacterium]|nr:universal stress protein [Gemmatimonadales bacterium]